MMDETERKMVINEVLKTVTKDALFNARFNAADFVEMKAGALDDLIAESHERVDRLQAEIQVLTAIRSARISVGVV